MLIGNSVGGMSGMMFAFAFACLMNFSAYWFSDRMVLAMTGAEPLPEKKEPQLYRIVRQLTRRAGLPMPRIYRIPSATANAFATGKDPQHAVVAVTDGILDLLTEEELRGVLAHELAHVYHRDMLVSSIAATLAGAIGLVTSLARWSLIFGRGNRGSSDRNPIALFVGMMIAPIVAVLIQLSVSRSREFHADEGGALFCGDPTPLANALMKLEKSVQKNPMRDANPATTHLFIVNPLGRHQLAKLFSTHPTTEERIARLKRMESPDFTASPHSSHTRQRQ